jgi:hypothetical protein
MSASTLPQLRTQPFTLVVAGGLVAGALDISYAWAFWAVKAEVPAQRIFQSVAAGLLGGASFTGGWGTAALGLFLHFSIAVSMAVTYWQVARRWDLLRVHPLACGAGYGLVLYAIMNYVVVPLSAARPGSKDPLWIALSVGVHVVFIGIPIAAFAHMALEREPPASIDHQR